MEHITIAMLTDAVKALHNRALFLNAALGILDDTAAMFGDTGTMAQETKSAMDYLAGKSMSFNHTGHAGKARFTFSRDTLHLVYEDTYLLLTLADFLDDPMSSTIKVDIFMDKMKKLTGGAA